MWLNTVVGPLPRVVPNLQDSVEMMTVRDDIRNIAIIAHVDHGELTWQLLSAWMWAQVLERSFHSLPMSACIRRDSRAALPCPCATNNRQDDAGGRDA
jgi:hypothetical protein